MKNEKQSFILTGNNMDKNITVTNKRVTESNVGPIISVSSDLSFSPKSFKLTGRNMDKNITIVNDHFNM